MKFAELPTPCFVVDESLLEKNLQILKGVRERAGCKILLAQKAFSAFALYPLISRYLDGATASGLFEARLGREHFRGENHVFCAAYKDGEFDEIASICGHVVFNSLGQLRKFKGRALARGAQVGLRVNPQFSTQQGHAIYDPCAPGSRLGVVAENLRADDLQGVSGLHFHTLCQQNSDDLEKTLEAVVEKFGKYFPQIKWINFGGGHHITREDYDIERLVRCVKNIREKFNLEVYLEPGEAVALNAGFLKAKVLDIVSNEIDIALLDASAACHMPDVLEMPYRPPLLNSGNPGEKPFNYRLAGATCLAGDVIGDYSFDTKLNIGDELVFADMAIYSMVKTNTFNGMPLPSIAVKKIGGDCEIIKTFGYSDFKNRLS
ncbi:MAG: carboxynorspermidine decarboxylase [Opitutales bacterium]|nr:carboxynorspermidine decarboxylase [Opitutales bacterium]